MNKKMKTHDFVMEFDFVKGMSLSKEIGVEFEKRTIYETPNIPGSLFFSKDGLSVKLEWFGNEVYLRRAGIVKNKGNYYFYIFQVNSEIDLFKLELDYNEETENFEDFSDILNIGTEKEKYVVKYLVLNNNALNKENLKIFKVKKGKVDPLNKELKNIITDKFQRIEFISNNGNAFFIKEKDKYTFRKLKKDRTGYFKAFRRIENVFICLTEEKKLEIYNFNGEQQYSTYEIIQKDLYDRNIRFLDLKNDIGEKKSILIRENEIIEIKKIRSFKFNGKERYIFLSKTQNKQTVENGKIIDKNIEGEICLYNGEGTLLLDNLEFTCIKGAKEIKSYDIPFIQCKYKKTERNSKRCYTNDENKKIKDIGIVEFAYLETLDIAFIREMTNMNLKELKYRECYTTENEQFFYIVFYEIYSSDLNKVNVTKVVIDKNSKNVSNENIDDKDRLRITEELIINDLEEGIDLKSRTLIFYFYSAILELI